MFFATKIFIVAKPSKNMINRRFQLTEWRKILVDVG